MVAAVETMAYAGKVPWHGLGNKVVGNLTPEEMLKASPQCDNTLLSVSRTTIY